MRIEEGLRGRERKSIKKSIHGGRREGGAQPHDQVSGWMPSSLHSAANQLLSNSKRVRVGVAASCFALSMFFFILPWRGTGFTENGRHGVIGCWSVQRSTSVLCSSTLGWKGASKGRGS